MKAKTAIRFVLCLLGMFAAPYFMTCPIFLAWLCTDVFGINADDLGLRVDYVILGGLIVGLSSFFALMGKTILKGLHSGLAVVAGFIYAPFLFFGLIYLLLPYLVPDL